MGNYIEATGLEYIRKISKRNAIPCSSLNIVINFGSHKENKEENKNISRLQSYLDQMMLVSNPNSIHEVQKLCHKLK